MGKSDRYDMDGADDDFDSSSSSTQTQAETSTLDDSPNSAKSTESVEEIPHRVRYDSPKYGRKAKTFYLDATEDLQRLRELHTVAESNFDEKVHRLDVYLAAFRSDLSDESFLAEMQRIGYGYFD